MAKGLSLYENESRSVHKQKTFALFLCAGSIKSIGPFPTGRCAALLGCKSIRNFLPLLTSQRLCVVKQPHAAYLLCMLHGSLQKPSSFDYACHNALAYVQ